MRLFFILLFVVVIQPVEAMENITPAIDGPNCLNGALVAAEILPYHRFTANSEMQIVLKSPLCQKIDKQDRSSGDIGLIINLGPYALPDIISHAFVYLSDSLSFEKRGYAKTEPYHTVATQTVLDDYSVDSIHSDEVLFYRCESWQTFLIKQQNQLSPDFLNAINETQILEEILQTSIVNNEGPEFLAVKKQIFKIAGLMADQAGAGHNEKIIGEMIAARLVSVATQLSALGDSSLFSVTQKWQYSGKGITEVFSLLGR